MKFFVIAPISNFINNRRIKSFHANMFHGLAERDGKEDPLAAGVYANSGSASPLMLSRTGRKVPDICKPSSHLVVNEEIAQQLQVMSNIRVVPVVFKRLVDVDYEAGDMSWDQKWGNVDPRQLLRTLPDVPEFHTHIGQYFEVQAWRLRDAVAEESNFRDVIIERGAPAFEARMIRLSPRILHDYPILCYGDVILNKHAFSICDSGLDRDYFIIREYELPGS
jgi:hypothetical protein